MRGVFYIVGPTATGKSALATRVARGCGGEIVSADAFQLYTGFDLLTAKPDAQLLRMAPHHLIGTVDPREEMNAQDFRLRALAEIDSIGARRKPVVIVGGSGLYVKTLTHGLSRLPSASAELRARLNQLSEGELFVRLRALDGGGARRIDRKNKRRLLRAVEICLLTGRPASEQRNWLMPSHVPAGVFVVRDREDLYERIDARVEMMFAHGVVEEVRAAGEVGPTAAKTLGLQQIRDLLAGRISEAECIASIQQATRRYAKRQLTWFRRQTTFEPLNLSRHDSSEAIEWISRKARLSFTPTDD